MRRVYRWMIANVIFWPPICLLSWSSFGVWWHLPAFLLVLLVGTAWILMCMAAVVWAIAGDEP